MICPVCRIEMIAVERHGIEVDYCISCRGFWFDRGEIDLLEEVTGYDAGELDGTASNRARPDRPCPRCNLALEEIVHERARLDRCPGGDGIWFDQGELGAVMRRHGQDSLSPVEQFLGEVFSVSATE